MWKKIFCFLFISLLVPVWLFAATASHVVFFSASPYGTGDLKDGSSNMIIVDGVAQMNTQTGNVGSGDCIEYTVVGVGSYKAYIAPCRLGFTGGNTEIKIGYKIKGKTSESHGIVRDVEMTSGSWAGNNAAGYIYFSETDGGFQDGEDLSIIKPSGVADVAVASGTLQGNMSYQFVVKNADGTEVNDTPVGGTITVDSIHHEASSLDAMDSLYTDANHINNTDLTDPNVDIMVHICGYYDHDDQTIDSTNLTIDSTRTSDSQHYPYFYIPIGETESINRQRHSGIWNNNKYVIETSSGNCINNSVNISSNYLRLEGFQCYQNGASGYDGIFITGETYVYLSDNIVKATLSGGDNNCYGIYIVSEESYIYNNIIYDFINGSKNNIGINLELNHAYIYSNTISNCNIGISNNPLTATWVYLKNNIVQDTQSVNYDGISRYHALSTHNIGNSAASELIFGATYSTGTTDGASANKLIDSDATLISDGTVIGCVIANTTDTTYTYVTALDSEGQLSINDDIFASGENYSIYTNKYGDVVFNNEGADDFHLGSGDTLAIDLGTDLSSDATLPFWMDIDGYERSIYGDGWDIGADEYEETENSVQIIYINISHGFECDMCDILETYCPEPEKILNCYAQIAKKTAEVYMEIGPGFDCDECNTLLTYCPDADKITNCYVI